MKIDYVYATLAVVAWIATLVTVARIYEIETRSKIAQAATQGSQP